MFFIMAFDSWFYVYYERGILPLSIFIFLKILIRDAYFQ